MGGSKLTIQGDGFTGLVAINIGNVIFYLTSANETMTYDSLSVVTLPNEGSFSVILTLNDLLVMWRTDSTYTFSAESTPIVSSVSPTSVNGPTELTLDGSGFGESDYLLSVKVGNQTCQVTSVNDTQIVCQLDGLEVGEQSVVVNVNGIDFILCIFSSLTLLRRTSVRKLPIHIYKYAQKILSLN